MAKPKKKPEEIKPKSDIPAVSQLPAVHHAPSVSDELSVEQLVLRVEKVHEVQKRVMREGVHYGVIPGCEKPTLLKAGAEILALTFKFDAEFEHEKEFDGEHLTVYSTCTLYHAPTGARVGSGKGSCSTKEEKYAYRYTSRRCPECGNESVIKGKQEFGGGWLCWKKKGGCGFKFPDGDKRIESQSQGKIPNDRIADCYNTVLKMADIRAHRAAILFTTAASDVFTQDMEETEPAADQPTSQPQPTQSKPSQATTGAPPPAGSAQSKGNGQRAYAFTDTHRKLKALIAGYIKENELAPDYEGKILIRLTTWTDKESKEHAGVSEWSRVSEKMAVWGIKRFNEAVKKKGTGQYHEPGSQG